MKIRTLKVLCHKYFFLQNLFQNWLKITKKCKLIQIKHPFIDILVAFPFKSGPNQGLQLRCGSKYLIAFLKARITVPNLSSMRGVGYNVFKTSAVQFLIHTQTLLSRVSHVVWVVIQYSGTIHQLSLSRLEDSVYGDQSHIHNNVTIE